MRRVRIISLILSAFMLLALFPSARADGAAAFDDVPASHWASGFITRLRGLGITDGVGGNRFGLGQTVSRAEFATFMCKVMGWERARPASGSFDDNQNASSWYYGYVEASAANGAVPRGGAFRPLEPITREEMAVMLVRALGYDGLAVRLEEQSTPFADVIANKGYITIARDLGIISGMTPESFAPSGTALREHAAAMLVKLVDILSNKPGWLNAFYAVSSASQMDAVGNFDCLSFGWSRLVLEGDALTLDSARSQQNEYGVPQGWEEPYGRAGDGTRLLMVAVSASDAPLIIGCPVLCKRAAELMADAALGIPGPDGKTVAFDGVVVDFEGLNGDSVRASYVEFLKLLRAGLDENKKLMAVAVQPQRREGLFSYSGYDYRAIGELADRVILMAHDYNAKLLTEDEMARGVVMTPLAPIEEVYWALRSITNEKTGVADRSKIALQFSFGTAQWKMLDGAVVNSVPYTPAFASVYERIRSGAEPQYSEKHESPYITFDNTEDNTKNIVWYEDARSIEAKMKLALLFGVTGFSCWRLGEIPDGPEGQYLNVLDLFGK